MPPDAITRPYPLVCAPMLLEKVWGGRRLSTLGKDIPASSRIGESWEVADLGATARGGAGGGSFRSIIDRGGMKGATIGACIGAWGERLIAPAFGDTFPLLIKYLDAGENLSVQVHPSPAYAARHDGAHLKTESWYILDAEPGAMIYKGVKSGVTRDAFARHIADGTVVDDLIAVPAIRGECHSLPSGTCHALGAGVMVAEVQTPSDTTFRVFDWGRSGRELHIEQALQCIEFGPAPEAVRLEVQPGESGTGRLATTDFYTINEARLHAGGEMPIRLLTDPGRSDAGRCTILMALSGIVDVVSAAGECDTTRLLRGETCIVPACLAPGMCIETVESSTVLVVGVRRQGQ